jgi:hypothetical protein
VNRHPPPGSASGHLWQVRLPAGTQPFGALFYNGERRLRARLQSPAGVGYYMSGGLCYATAAKQAVDSSLCNLGSFLRVAAEIPPVGANANCPSVTNSDGSGSKCLDRFQYNPSDPVANWINLNPAGSICGGSPNAYPVGDVELYLFDAWTVDALRVGCVDTVNHVIYFTGPTKGNPSGYNFFGPTTGHRYIVENTRNAFEEAEAAGQTGLWFLDRSASPWTLNYLANPGEDPNKDSVVIAQLQPVSSIGGSLISAANLMYVTFRGITFEVDNFVSPASGFVDDENSDDTLPEAIDCESCQNVTFDGIIVRRTAASGILIASSSGDSGQPASNDIIENSAFYDVGDCGIRIGHHPAGSDKPANVVQLVTVENNIVQGYSRVFADGEGISQANGHDITYLHNDVTDGYHAGMSICLLGCPGHTANGFNILSQYNHVWNIMQGITSDGGTLYYNIGASDGSGTGNRILSNLVHDTTDSSVIDSGFSGTGYGGEGIYLDNQSAGVDVENNVVYNITAAAAWMSAGPAPGQPPNTFKNNIFAYARDALFEPATAWPQGCVSPSLRENIISNIFTFDRNDTSDFYVTQGCAYSCGLPYNGFLNFQGNLYWRTDGKFSSYNRAFHVETTAPRDVTTCGSSVGGWTFLTFPQWQALGEDAAGTAAVNPGFASTGQPADYLLSTNSIAGFDYTKTNDTLRNAGRNNPVIAPPQVAPTFPTYTYTSW